MPRLIRERDGAGDSGAMLVQLRYNDLRELQERNPEGPDDLEIGWAVRCGSITARSYSYQDYWTTTPITEILEKGSRVVADGDEPREFVRFKTGNSTYILEF